jgi:outer membrane protein OmpA-like peptidoglycan-associated protein/Tol biopolymer transport system component
MKKTLSAITITALMLISVMIVSPNRMYAQDEAKVKSSNSALDFAEAAYFATHYSQASNYYEEYIKNEKNPDKVALAHLADCYWQMRDYPLCLATYKKLYPNGKDNSTQIEQLRIGELYARDENYKEAAKWIGNNKLYREKSDTYKSAQKLVAMAKDSVNWNLSYLDINSKYREFCPLVIDSTLIFCSNRPLKKKANANYWDGDQYARLWQVSLADVQNIDMQTATEELENRRSEMNKPAEKNKAKRIAGIYENGDSKPRPQAIQKTMPKEYVESKESFAGKMIQGIDKVQFNAGAVSVDSMDHFYFSANYPKANKKNINRIRIMEGSYSETSITNITPLPFGDPEQYSVMHPAISPDGKIIVFSSDKEGGKGGYDLYYAKQQSGDNGWSEMKALGSAINSAGNEVFPSISRDGTLYFSSDTKAGLGGLDIYKIPLKNAIKGVGKPEHLPYPINSSGDDFGWTEDIQGTTAYFTSDRISSEDNIYKVNNITDPAKAIRPVIVADNEIKMEGYVLERQTMVPIDGATVFILDQCSKKVQVTKTDKTGYYAFAGKPGCTVSIKAAYKNMSEDCLNAYIRKPGNDQTTQSVPHDLLLDKFKKGYKWKLNNIYYDYNKWNIRADARPALDSLTDILRKYPISIELSSHTDSRGSVAYNDRLSQKRADAAVAYIVAQGINPNRIVGRGYGAHQLVNRCAKGVQCSEAEHQMNRRTEVKVISGMDSDLPVTFDPANFKIDQQIDEKDLPANFFKLCK